MRILFFILLFISSFLQLFVVSVSSAEVVEVDDQELARESVLPKFEFPQTVLNRNIVTENRLELGGFVGWATDEAIFSQMHYGVLGTYHFTETHGFNFQFGVFNKGVSSYADDIKKEIGIDYSNAFAPENFILLNYQLTMFYGKMSIFRESPLTLHTYLIAGLGAINYKGKSELCYDFGLGQRYYFTKSWAMRFDLKWLRYNGPSPVSVTGARLNSGTLGIKDFDNTSYFSTHLALSLVYLF